jgi:hypothetical protein
MARRKQGPIQFLENNPIQSSLWVRFMCPKTRRNWLPSNCKIPSGVQLPPAAALRRSHSRAEGHRHFRAIQALDRYRGPNGDFVRVWREVTRP